MTDRFVRNKHTGEICEVKKLRLFMASLFILSLMEIATI